MKASRLPWLVSILIVIAALGTYGEASTPPRVEKIDPPLLRALAPRQPSPAATGNPFAIGAAVSGDATMPPSTEPPRAAPPAPSLAPLPGWRAIGKQYDEEHGWAVFLARGEETRVVRNGDLLDDHLRVVAIQPPLLTLQHLRKPLRLTLDIGEAKE